MGLTDEQKLTDTWAWKVIAEYGDNTITFYVVGDDIVDAQHVADVKLTSDDKPAARIVYICRLMEIWDIR